MKKPTRRRSKEPLTVVAIKLPKSMLEKLDNAVAHEDSDRSKFARRAIREKLTRLGITV